MKSFRQYIIESEGIYDSIVNSIESRLRDEHSKKLPNEPFSLESAKRVRAHDALLESQPTRSRMERHQEEDSFSLGNFPMKWIRSHYKFYVPNEKNSRAPHHVLVTFQRGVAEGSTSRPVHSISFEVDGHMSFSPFSDFDFRKQHAIYSGVMDAISHHAIEHGHDMRNYHYLPVALTSEKTRAKTKRFQKIANLLVGRSGRST